MQSASVASTAPVVGMEFEEPEAIIAKPQELAIQCVVFVGNLLTELQMRSPNYRLGGKLFPNPDFRTVPNGIVPRCAITRLRKAYRGYHQNMIDPKEWDHWIQGYTLKNQYNPATGQFEDIVVGGEHPTRRAGMREDARTPSSGLRFKEIKPVQELRGIIGGGVIALDDACGIERGEDIKEAQFHYFPNWERIVLGEDKLPTTLRELQDHLRNRREQAISPALKAIGDAYLASCSDFRTWAKEARIDIQTKAIELAKTTDGEARYDEVTERLFKELELQRQDQLVESMAKDRNDAIARSGGIETAITLLTELVAQQKAEQTLPPIESQAPAPATVEEAQAEIERAVEDEVAVEFTDMSAITVTADPIGEVITTPSLPNAAVTDGPVDPAVAEYLEKQGVKAEEGE